MQRAEAPSETGLQTAVGAADRDDSAFLQSWIANLIGQETADPGLILTVRAADPPQSANGPCTKAKEPPRLSRRLNESERLARLAEALGADRLCVGARGAVVAWRPERMVDELGSGARRFLMLADQMLDSSGTHVAAVEVCDHLPTPDGAAAKRRLSRPLAGRAVQVRLGTGTAATLFARADPDLREIACWDIALAEHLATTRECDARDRDADASTAPQVPAASLVIDAHTRHAATLIVGPPGSGRSTRLADVITSLHRSPSHPAVVQIAAEPPAGRKPLSPHHAHILLCRALALEWLHASHGITALSAEAHALLFEADAMALETGTVTLSAETAERAMFEIARHVASGDAARAPSAVHVVIDDIDQAPDRFQACVASLLACAEDERWPAACRVLATARSVPDALSTHAGWHVAWHVVRLVGRRAHGAFAAIDGRVAHLVQDARAAAAAQSLHDLDIDHLRGPVARERARLGHLGGLLEVLSGFREPFLVEEAARALAIAPSRLDEPFARLRARQLLAADQSTHETRYQVAPEPLRRAILRSLAPARRRRLFARIAAAREETATTRPDACDMAGAARLWEAAGQLDRAYRAWLRAGQDAARRNESETAANAFRRALRLAHRLPEQRRATTELKARIAYCEHRGRLAGRAERETITELRRCLRSSAVAGTQARASRVLALTRLAEALRHRGAIARARACTQKIAALCDPNSATEQALRHSTEAWIAYHMGDVVRANAGARAALHHLAADPQPLPGLSINHQDLITRHTCITRVLLAMTDALMDRGATALAEVEAVLGDAERGADSFTCGQVLTLSIALHWLVAGRIFATPMTFAARAIGQHHNIDELRAYSALLDNASVVEMDPPRAMRDVDASLAEYKRSRSRAGLAFAHYVHARVAMANGRLDVAHASVDNACEVSQTLGFTVHQPEYERLKAVIAHRAGNDVRAVCTLLARASARAIEGGGLLHARRINETLADVLGRDGTSSCGCQGASTASSSEAER